jgi:ribosomal protein L11 methyltransferase
MLVLVLTAPPDEVEIAADHLWSLGVVAVEERTTADGVVELWTSLGDDTAAAADAIDAFPPGWQWRWETVDESVADTWREFAAPVWVDDDLVVCPAWVPTPDGIGPDTIVVHIEPGATFGLGDHPTTRLSMLAVRRALGDRVEATVLDVGCGSGVLAIGAVLFGAASAVGIDIAPAAVPTTLDNAVRNGVDDRVQVSTMPLAEVEGTYELVVANILAPTLVELADDLLRVLAADGTLVISGVLDGRFDHVVAALAPARVVAVDVLDGWAAVTLRR